MLLDLRLRRKASALSGGLLLLYGGMQVSWPSDPAPQNLDNPVVAATPAAPVFPTQYAGLRVYYHGTANDLCLVATADAPSGVGGQIRIRKNGVTYAVYLVDVADPNASPVRVKTTTGVYAIRVKT